MMMPPPESPWLLQHLFAVLNFVLTLIFVSFILRSKRPPGSTLAWLFFVAIIPYVGIPLYIFLSDRKYKNKVSRRDYFNPGNRGMKSHHSHANAFERVLVGLGAPPPRVQNKVDLLTTGETSYARMVELIEGAKHSIRLTTFIFSRDDVGNAIVALLAKKAAEGVEVEVLVDSLGALWVKLPSFKKLRKNGGRVAHFMPILHIPFRGRTNLRNHRKMLVIDSRYALIGGMNIAKEYMGPAPDEKRWTDLSASLEGQSVEDIENIFIADWYFATGEGLVARLPTPLTPPKESAVEIVASGPDVNGDPLYDALLTLIFEAKKRIWIATPYFIPDESLAKALELAAKRGIDLRLLLPEKSNHFLADLARGSYLRQLETVGCHMFFLPKMMHAKAFLVDEELALIGSANFDMRSLLLNYEAGAFLFAKDFVHDLEKWFSHQFSLSYKSSVRRGYWRELAESAGRILGPLI